ncbi:hypothetical protein BKM09_031635 (plasmid) [Pseudomonas amygdali pv. morsprunorum]|nr:hypothetical protein BKM09_031635 [Pseudomonas amygdali pv. morsprunorum]
MCGVRRAHSDWRDAVLNITEIKAYPFEYIKGGRTPSLFQVFFFSLKQAARGRPALRAATAQSKPPMYDTTPMAVASLRSLRGRFRLGAK